MINPQLKKGLGLALVALSFIFYGALLLVPFAPVTAGHKVVLSSALVVLGEGSFWIAVLIMGKEMASKCWGFDWRSKLRGLPSTLKRDKETKP